MKEVAFRLLDTNAISREGRRVIACLIRPPPSLPICHLNVSPSLKVAKLAGGKEKGEDCVLRFGTSPKMQKREIFVGRCIQPLEEERRRQCWT